MQNSILNSMKSNIRNNIILYFLVLLCFLVGISVGGFTVKVISPSHKQEIVSYLNSFFQLFTAQGLNKLDIFTQSFINNIQLLSLSWISGLLVISIPAIILIILFKGFVIGFTVGLLIEQFKFKGVLLFLVGVLPHNLIIIPIFIAAGVTSILFTITIIKKKLNKSNKLKEVNFYKEMIPYTAIYVLFTAFVLVAVSIEAFISPVFIKLINTYIQ